MSDNKVILLEHDGIYTAYQKQAIFDDDGNCKEKMIRVQIPMPNPDIPFVEWAKGLNEDQIEIGLQFFFDKWNFTSGNDTDREAYEALYRERSRRATDRARKIWDSGYRDDKLRVKMGMKPINITKIEKQAG